MKAAGSPKRKRQRRASDQDATGSEGRVDNAEAADDLENPAGDARVRPAERMSLVDLARAPSNQHEKKHNAFHLVCVQAA